MKQIARLACCLTLGASAATYYVDNKLDDYTGHNGSSWALAYHRIQDAVARAASGDTVIVAPGTYGDDQGTVVDAGDTTGQNANYSYQKNRIWINNKHITLKSSEGAAVTHIVGKFAATETGIGSNAVRCIAMSGNNALPGTRIEGFTFREGATLAYNTGKTFNSSGAEVLACPAAHRGGALLFNYTPTTTHRQVHVVDCVISNCVAAEGAAAYGMALVRCRVTRNHTYRDNDAAHPFRREGGLGCGPDGEQDGTEGNCQRARRPLSQWGVDVDDLARPLGHRPRRRHMRSRRGAVKGR